MLRCARRWPLAGVLAAGALCCDSGRGEAERTIFSFVDAVQSENLDSRRCLPAGSVSEPDRSVTGPHRAAFDDWARSRYAAYLAGRDPGGADFGADGIVPVKTWAVSSVEVGPGTLSTREIAWEF